MTKAPIKQALELLEKNLAFMNRHANGNDFFMELYDENEQALKDLQAWVDDVPEDTQDAVDCGCPDMWTGTALGIKHEAAKHLLKGIEG